MSIQTNTLVDTFGNKSWYKDGILYRENSPDFEEKNGTKKWYKDGVLHREDGPAWIDSDGSKYWFINGKPHREDGPATEYIDGPKFWVINGKLHRLDGPAAEYMIGWKQWYLNGINYNEKEYNKIIRLAKIFLIKMKIKLRKKYICILSKTTILNEKLLYNVISRYII